MRKFIAVLYYIIDKCNQIIYFLINYIHVNYSGYILMYHDIFIDGNEDTCHCSLQSFREQLHHFKKKYIFISIDQLLDVITSNKCINNFMIISFDDVFESVYINAFPLLKYYNIPFVIYQTTNLIDKEGYLKKWQIIEMLESGLCTLGSHGVTHCMLSKLSTNEIDDEMKKSKEILEKEFNVYINHFAYPYGKLHSVGIKAPKIARKYYKTAVVTVPERVNYLAQINKYLIGRVVPGFNYNISKI